MPTLSEEEINKDKAKYTRKISVPVYEPKEKRPLLSEIFDTSKRDSLCAEIDSDDDLKGDSNRELRDFLKSAAERHVVFNFSKIADYYSHLPVKYKKFFETSGLVIVDYDNAIRNAFVSYEKEIETERLDYIENILTEELQKTRIDKLRVKQLEEEKAYLEGKKVEDSFDAFDEEW